jgi:AMP-binding enzyme family protein (fragment)
MNTILTEALARSPHGAAICAAACALASRLRQPQRLACENPLTLVAALIACAIASEPAELLPRDDGAPDTLRDSDIPLTSAAHNAPPLPPLHDIPLILSTSGTTGTGSRVPKTLGAMLRESAALLTLPHWPRSATALGSVHPQHLYGLTFRTIHSLLAGWHIDPAQHRYPELLLDASRRSTTPQVWISTPALLHTLVAGHDLTPWRGRVACITSAGGALDPAFAAALRAQLGCAVLDIYGSTESGVISIDDGTGRRPLPGVTTRRDPDGALHVKSPWTHGWIATGDLVDEAHNLLGRSDRIIKRGDKRIALNALEHSLNSDPTIADSHCALHPDSGHLCAWIALSDDGIRAWRDEGRPALLARWRALLLQQHDRLAVPRHIRVTDRLPRNSQGKIARADWECALREPILAPAWQPGETDGDIHTYRARVPLDLHYCKGHFDRMALVPGVVQCRWALALAARDLGLTATISAIEQLKYQQFLRPYDLLALTLRYDAARGKLHFTCDNGHGKCASGRIVYRLNNTPA